MGRYNNFTEMLLNSTKNELQNTANDCCGARQYPLLQSSHKSALCFLL